MLGTRRVVDRSRRHNCHDAHWRQLPLIAAGNNVHDRREFHIIYRR